VMRILQVSDMHGSLEAAAKTALRAEGFDAVFVVGDITHFGGIPQAEVLLEKVAESGREVFFVGGNCDHESILTWIPKNPRIHNLHLCRESFQGVELIGIGGGNLSPFNTFVEFSEEEFSSMLSRLAPSSERFVLVSHTPPHGTDADVGRGTHLGSKAVRTYVEKYRPLAVLCGHIHEARSASLLGRTWVVNAGPARDGYCASITINYDNVSVELLRL
jgi:Icc-related predicted phosphoesterase